MTIYLYYHHGGRSRWMICFDKSVRETEFQAENGDAGGGLFWRTVIDSNIPLKLGHGLFFPTYLEESFCLV